MRIVLYPRPKLWTAVLLWIALGVFWDAGPRQLARAVYVTLWALAPAPFDGVTVPDRFAR
jgi:hypothetical protein